MSTNLEIEAKALLTKEDYDFYVNELRKKEKIFKMNHKLKNIEKDF